MRKWLLTRIKYWLCGEELDALERYRTACSLVWRWNGQLPQSAHTARWIQEVGDGRRGQDISEFREDLRNDRDPFRHADSNF